MLKNLFEVCWKGKNADTICYKLRSLVSLQQGNVKKSRKLMKVANIDREIVHNFWTTWGISVKFSGKMWLMALLKATKKQAFSLSLEETFFEKPQGTAAVLQLRTKRTFKMK